MKDWRETGVVPDSEDELEEEDLDSLRDESTPIPTPTPADTNHAPIPPSVIEQNELSNATRVEERSTTPIAISKEDDSSIWDIPASSAESNADASKKVWSSQTDGSISRSSPADLPGIPPPADDVEGDSKTPLDKDVAVNGTNNVEEEEYEDDDDDDMVELVVHPSDVQQAQEATNEIPAPKSSPRRSSLEIPSSQDSEVIDEELQATPKKQTADTTNENDENDDEKTPRPRDTTPTPLPRQNSLISSPLSPALSLDEPPADFSITRDPNQTPPRPPPFAVVLTKTPTQQLNSPNHAINSSPPPPPASTLAGNNLNDDMDTIMQDTDTNTDGIAGRLRHRQPIQLNPYAIEQERYRQTWKSRGLRPVRFVEPTLVPHAPRPTAHDSQEDDYSTNSQREDGELPSSSIGVPEDLENIRDEGNDYDDNDTGSNLPSVDDLFDQEHRQRRNSDPRIHSSGTKRRRVDITDRPTKHHHIVMPKSAKTAKALLNKTASISNAVRLADRTASPDPFDFPSSPPAIATLNDDGNMPMADDSSSDDLPISPQKRRRSPENNRLSSTPRPTGITVISSSSEGESDDSSQERRLRDQEEKERKKMAHRMRGVLPASFVTISEKTLAMKKNQKEQHQHQQNAQRQTGGASRPGLARKVVKGSNPDRPRDGLDQMFQPDDSSSEEEAPRSRLTPNFSASSPMPGTAPSRPIDLGDSFEDNSIDMMVSRGPRNSSTQTNIKRTHSAPMRQSRLPFEAGSSRKRKSLGNSSSSKPKSKKTKHSTTTIKPRRTHQQVSILDVNTRPVLNPRTGRISAPQFLNVAKRRARQKKDQGRCGPQGKFIQLADDEDADEVSQIMRNWREGTLAVEKAPELPRSSEARSKTSNYSSNSRAHNGRVFQSRLNMTPLKPGGNSRENAASSSKQHQKPERRPLAIVTPSENTIFQTHAPPLKQTQLETVRFTQPYVAPTHGRLENVLEYLLVNSAAANAPKASAAPKQSRTLNTANNNSHLVIRQRNDTLQAVPHSAVPHNVTHDASRRRRKAAPIRKPLAGPKVYAMNSDVSRAINSIEAINDNVSSVVPKPSEPASDYLTHLAPSGTLYTFDFNIAPFREGVHFQRESFIGSGDLDRAVKTDSARIGAAASSDTIAGNFFGKQLYWSQWDQEVGAQFETMMRNIGDKMEDLQNGQIMDSTLNESSVDDCLAFHRFHVNYVFNNLSFSDRTGLIMFKDFVVTAVDDLYTRMDFTALASAPRGSEFAVRTLMFSLVHLVQLDRLLEHDPSDLLQELKKTASLIIRQLIIVLLKIGLSSLKGCFEAQKRHTERERGISSDNYVVEAWAALYILSKESRLVDDPLWPTINDSISAGEITKTKSIPALEDRWNIIFTLLPIMQFDSIGRVASFPAVLPNNWTIVKQLVERVLVVYKAASSTTTSQAQYNPYIRAVFARCFYLISRWHWARPKPIILIIFNFFKSRKLMNLAKEKDGGSPRFMEQLGHNPILDVHVEDLGIHILLKIIIVGITFLVKTAPDSAVRDLAMLLYPLHGRQLLKEQEVQTEELYALRNHFGILTAIYCSVPPKHRQVTVLADLVIPEEAHLDACKASLKAWSNVVTFQLSQDCDPTCLKPLMEWFSNIMQKTLGLHQQAQTQANNQYQALLKAGEFTIDEAHFKHIVRKNRRRLEDIIYHGMGLLQSAMKEMPKVASAMVAMMTSSATTSIFNLVTLLPDNLIIGSLNLVLQFISLAESSAQYSEQQSNEDSQNYDTSGYEEAFIEADLKPATDFLKYQIHNPLHRLLSNCFGADISKSEQVLESCIKTWVSLVGFLVNRNSVDWSDYVFDGIYSWLSLRGTEKTKVYASRFMKQVVERSYGAYEENKTEFFKFWLTSLVTRHSMLKYEHEFTSTLFNEDQSNPLFQNPPFERKSDGRFDITRKEFKDRRISLISTVLENIWMAYEAPPLSSAGTFDLSRPELKVMLSSLMRAMISNCQSFEENDSTYVKFIQDVVELLQQYTADILPVDKYFVDSKKFPLPATDPQYVVGRLKNYGLKLDSEGLRKRLASFFRTTCERAVVGRHQEYLISQLTAAYQPSYEILNLKKPSLRFTTVLTLIPAYVFVSLASIAGRVLAEPIMEVTERIMEDMMVCVNSFEPASVEAVLTMIVATWDALRESVKEWLHHRQAVVLTAGMLHVLKMFFRILAASIPTFAWLSSTTHTELNNLSALLKHGHELAEYFVELSADIEERLHSGKWPDEQPVEPTTDSSTTNGTANVVTTTTTTSDPYNPPFLNESKSFKADLINDLRKDWMLMGDTLFVNLKGNKQVILYEKYETIQKQQAVCEELLNAMHEFRMVAGRYDGLVETVMKRYAADIRRDQRRNLRVVAGMAGRDGGYFNAYQVESYRTGDGGNGNNNDDNDDEDDVFDFSD